MKGTVVEIIFQFVMAVLFFLPRYTGISMNILEISQEREEAAELVSSPEVASVSQNASIYLALPEVLGWRKGAQQNNKLHH